MRSASTGRACTQVRYVCEAPPLRLADLEFVSLEDPGTSITSPDYWACANHIDCQPMWLERLVLHTYSDSAYAGQQVLNDTQECIEDAHKRHTTVQTFEMQLLDFICS